MSYRSKLIQVAAVAIAMAEDFDSGTTALSGDGVVDDLSSYLEEVYRERIRQEEKWGPQHHEKEKWLTILGEEFGEVARAILEKDY